MSDDAQTLAELDVVAAYEEAASRFGADKVADPRRCRAIVSDLSGSTGRDHRQAIDGLCAAVEAAGSQAKPSRSQVMADVRRRDPGRDPDWALRAVSQVAGVDFREDDPSGHRRPAILAAIIAALVVVVMTLLLVPRFVDDGTDSATSSTQTTESKVTTPAEPAVTATFAPVREGPFMVERVWRAEGTDIVVTVGLRSDDGAAAAGVHREALLNNSGATFSFNPEPAGPPVAGVASYDVNLQPSELFRFSYRVSEAPQTASEAALQQQFDAWAPRRDAAIPPIDPRDPLSEPAYEQHG